MIDVGSNSVLLCVEERPAGASEWRLILDISEVTALGEGVKQSGILSERGMTNTLAAIAKFWRIAKDQGAESIEAYATMAARIATNAPDFLGRAAAQGTPVSLLTGLEEAQLGLEAVAYDPFFAKNHTITIIDPGGQSTELTTAMRSQEGLVIVFRHSFPIGTLGLRSGELSDPSPGPVALIAACQQIDDIIGLCYRPGTAGRVVVLGAAGTNLVSIKLQLPEWNPERVHGYILNYEDISRAVGELSPLGDDGRAALPGLEPGRERTIHLGALILERFLLATRAPEVAVSVRGWRHALLERGKPIILNQEG